MEYQTCPHREVEVDSVADATVSFPPVITPAGGHEEEALRPASAENCQLILEPLQPGRRVCFWHQH